MSSFLPEPDTWGTALKEGVEKKELDVIPYELKLDYDYWSYRMKPEFNPQLIPVTLLTFTIDDIITSILPEELHDDIPSGFNTAGHVGK